MKKAKAFKNVVVLTGAGISQESGIRTFRDQGGLWEDHRIEDVASYDGYLRNPVLVLDFYNKRRRQLLSPEVRPNPAHVALAQFEKKFSGNFLLVTQNVDNLHESAGSKNVLHMHGELLKMRCQRTGIIYPAETDIHLDSVCRCCGIAGGLRPHIVWFGEIPLHMEEIQMSLSACDCFIAIGTSGQVYPAAMFVDLTPVDCHRVELNLQDTHISSKFAEHRTGPASKIVPEFLMDFLSHLP